MEKDNETWLQQSNEATPAQIWKQINYEQFKEQLEKMSMDIVEKQNQSKTSRKRLTETTKEFKHSSSEEKAKNLNTLLKSYQSEIDRLTTRATFAESCFFQVVQKLYATTDPCLFIAELEEWKWKYQQVVEEKKQLKQELDQFHRETIDVQRQDATIRQLQKQLKQLEEDTERKVAEKSKQLEAEWNETLKNTKAHQESQQSIWTQEIEQYKEKLANLQKAYDSVQNRLFETSHQLEEIRGVKSTEHQILLQELEQSREENRDLNRKISELLLSRNRNVSSSESSEAKDSYSNLVWKDGKIRQLERQLDNLKAQMEECQVSYRQELEDKQQVILKMEMQTKQLEQLLEEAPSLDEVQRLRKQITNLQALQFDHVELFQGEECGKEPTDLETLLMEKNRTLEDQLSHLRVTVQNIEKEKTQYQQQALSLEESLSDQKEVNRKLERALNETLKVHPPPSSISVSLENSSNSSQQSIPEEQGILDIVCQQRDRYKHKMLEYEDQLDKMRERISLLNATVETLRNESRRTSHQVVDSSVSERRKTQWAEKESLSLMLEQGNNDTLTWPETSYAGVSRRWLRQRRSFEKWLYRWSLSILRNRYATLFLFFYIFFLHLFVLFILYRTTHQLGSNESQSLTEAVQLE
ncbi:hypothetical protein GpartN1_g7094.t1 [Galdieria partita]|uniref:Protein CASP n=1 Tax=Galdieria partita TaxID=83374 RepID=A0A9C7Q2K2_9RHOD|nr:hypothetical protein GpartN1_g7094.t1 [Galdieria partita]